MKQHSLRYGVAIAAGIAVLSFAPMTAAAQAPVASAAPTASEATPHTADGKPDLTGLWTGNPGSRLVIDEQGNLRYTASGRGDASTGITAVNFERDSTLSRRSDPNKPMYKAEFWEKVAYLDDNRNREDSYFSCANPGVPRMGPPSQIVQTDTAVIFLYARQNNFRVIPTDREPV